MEERRKLIREIEALVDYNPNIYARAAFYSDRDVLRILDELYKRWESSGRIGSPLEYATDDELRILHSKALRYKDVTDLTVLTGEKDPEYEMLLRSISARAEREKASEST